MLFNSFEFLLLFIPIVLLGTWIVSKHSRTYGLAFLSFCSLVFYSLWIPEHLLILIASILFNFFCAKKIQKYRENNYEKSRIWLYFGIAVNLVVLICFKYANFLSFSLHAYFPQITEVQKLPLPLAISFFTFQQISFLFAARQAKLNSFDALRYTFFISFFPQLIAGPIVLYREIFPQLKKPNFLAFNRYDIVLGITLFILGLFKKTVLADTLFTITDPFFAQAYSTGALHWSDAWYVLTLYTFQIYFDFSGYSDMAIGLARIFGIILPVNFLSPLKSRSILTLWRNWHITLTRFVMTYIFIPLGAHFARRASKIKRLKSSQRIVSSVPAMFIALFIIGIWHGAGWNFFIFGLLHGFFASINFAWEHWRRKLSNKRFFQNRAYGLTCIIITFSCFAIGLVPFRAPDFNSTLNMWSSLINTNGEFTVMLFDNYIDFVICSIAPLIIFLSPNIYQILKPYKPALNIDHLEYTKFENLSHIPLSGVLTGLTFFLAIMFLSKGPVVFIYFNF